MRRNLVLFYLYTALFLGFLAASDANYRSPQGRLGRTHLHYQSEIVDGTAPAPYVYRQAVPRLRAVLMLVLLPGHAAMALDAFFAILAMVAGARLARSALGPEFAAWGGVLATFACVLSYSPGMPESVPGVAVPLVIVLLLERRRYAWSASLAAASAVLRPEIPVLLGTAVMVAALAERGVPGWARVSRWFALTSSVGLAYLLSARFLLWPEAPYVDAPPLARFAWNLQSPVAWPGAVLVLSMVALGTSWILRPSAEGEERILQRAIGLFAAMYGGVLLLITFVWEVRLFMPLVTILVLLGLRWHSRGASGATAALTL